MALLYRIDISLTNPEFPVSMNYGIDSILAIIIDQEVKRMKKKLLFLALVLLVVLGSQAFAG